MSDEDRIEALVRSARDPEEALEFLKWQHRAIQKERLDNARDFEFGKKSEKDAKALATSCDQTQKVVEKYLKSTGRGREYLDGKGARDVKEQLEKENVEARKKEVEAKRAAKIDAELKKNPPMKAAEVSAEEAKKEKDANKGRVGGAMSFLLKSSKQKDMRPKPQKKHDRSRDRDWEPE